MRKGKRLIDRPILSLADGVRVGAVKDVILGPENDQVIGLLTDEGGLLSSAHFVPLGEVQSFGKDAIVVRSTDSVLPADRAPDIKAILERDTSLLGIKVFTDTGEAQGTVNDVYFDESSRPRDGARDLGRHDQQPHGRAPEPARRGHRPDRSRGAVRAPRGGRGAGHPARRALWRHRGRR